MEYIILFICLVVGLGLGSLFMHKKLNAKIVILKKDLDIAYTRLKELLGHYNVERAKKDKVAPTMLDDTFKSQLQLKDDKIDRINALTNVYQTDKIGLQKNLETAAAQILILESRISKNKKVAIKRETDLTEALSKINTQLKEIDALESDTNRGGMQLRSSTDEISVLTKMSASKDNSIERLNKRISELELELEAFNYSEPNETGGYKRMKKFE